ncbi:MAG: hypothetical protein JJU11_18590 [Candidatus Sumerlaeia bacterium]|nr:hypothetical protein [Candidatus Sumerlaeia bacterium]
MNDTNSSQITIPKWGYYLIGFVILFILSEIIEMDTENIDNPRTLTQEQVRECISGYTFFLVTNIATYDIKFHTNGNFSGTIDYRNGNIQYPPTGTWTVRGNNRIIRYFNPNDFGLTTQEIEVINCRRIKIGSSVYKRVF